MYTSHRHLRVRYVWHWPDEQTGWKKRPIKRISRYNGLNSFFKSPGKIAEKQKIRFIKVIKKRIKIPQTWKDKHCTFVKVDDTRPTKVAG